MKIYHKKEIKNNKKNERTIKIMAVIFTVLLLSACQKQVDIKLDISTENTMQEFVWENQDYSGLEYNSSLYIYPDEYKLHSITTNMETATVGNRTYGFEKAIPKEERKACIEATEIILARVGYDDALNIYVYTDELGGGSYYIDQSKKNESGNSFITYISDWKGADYVTGVLLSVYGKYGNYGVAYGYANYLCDSLLNVWENITDDTDDNRKNIVSDTQSNEANYGQPVFDAQYNCYDLNLLCFDDDFVTADEIVEAKAVSSAFVRDYIKNNGEDALKELLKKSGDVQLCHEFNTELGKWYNENGLVLSKPLSEVLYSYGGYSYQYVVYNEYAVFYIDRKWKDTIYYMNPLVTENFLHEDYARTKEFYEINTEQMRQYRELFDIEDCVMDVPVVLSNKKISIAIKNKESEFAHGRIYLRDISSLTHEYIHAICTPTALGDFWAVEGWARPFDMRYNYYGYDYLNIYWNGIEEDSKDFGYIIEFISKKGSPIDMRTDYKDVDSLGIYYNSYYSPDYNYESGASFIYYLSDTYGEKKVIDYVCKNHDLTTVTDKTYSELVEDWKNYMENKYSEYSKIDNLK